MNKKNYTVDEILSAINELNEKKVKVDLGIKKESDYLFNSEIPKNTLKLIEEAEKNNN